MRRIDYPLPITDCLHTTHDQIISGLSGPGPSSIPHYLCFLELWILTTSYQHRIPTAIHSLFDNFLSACLFCRRTCCYCWCLAMNQTILLALEETSSRDKSLISQGLDRLETLLTQICLSNDSETASFSSDKSRAVSFMSSSQVTDFLDSQDSFMYNIASRLVPVLSFLATAQESSSLIAQTLDIIHGLCLVHYRSRECFVTSDSMKVSFARSHYSLSLLSSVLTNFSFSYPFLTIPCLLHKSKLHA